MGRRLESLAGWGIPKNGLAGSTYDGWAGAGDGWETKWL